MIQSAAYIICIHQTDELSLCSRDDHIIPQSETEVMAIMLLSVLVQKPLTNYICKRKNFPSNSIHIFSITEYLNYKWAYRELRSFFPFYRLHTDNQDRNMTYGKPRACLMLWKNQMSSILIIDHQYHIYCHCLAEGHQRSKLRMISDVK